MPSLIHWTSQRVSKPRSAAVAAALNFATSAKNRWKRREIKWEMIWWSISLLKIIYLSIFFSFSVFFFFCLFSSSSTIPFHTHTPNKPKRHFHTWSQYQRHSSRHCQYKRQAGWETRKKERQVKESERTTNTADWPWNVCSDKTLSSHLFCSFVFMFEIAFHKHLPQYRHFFALFIFFLLAYFIASLCITAFANLFIHTQLLKWSHYQSSI